MVTEFEIIQLIDYFNKCSKFDIFARLVLLYLLAKYLLNLIRFVYGYGIIYSVKFAYRTVSKRIFYWLLTHIPSLKRKVDLELVKVKADIEKELVTTSADLKYFNQIPNKGLSDSEIESELNKYLQLDHNDWENGKVSGAVYHGGDKLIKLQAYAFEKYCVSNQLHPDSFPGLRKMESEIVSMCLDIFNAPSDTGCGTTSSGGTESLLLACLSAKMYALKHKNIKNPEIIAPETVHAGIDKACYYFNIKLHKVPLNSKYQGDISYYKSLINKNTILLVGSAPNFPHGIIDDIESLSKLACKHKIPLHVDCCLGSFVISYMSKIGEDIPKFDFTLPGVTSISCDTHKYGFAPKGSSIIMYRNAELRSCQYYVITDWIGGLYGSPTLSGSRPGALMAGCWTTMVSIGDEGYKKYCKDIIKAARYFKSELQNDEELNMDLQIIGDPILSVISFKSDTLNIYELSDILNKKFDWHLSALQNPPALHIAFTVLSSDIKVVDDLIKDLKFAISTLKAQGNNLSASSETAQLYGTAGNVSTTGIVERLIEAFLDTLYTTPKTDSK